MTRSSTITPMSLVEWRGFERVGAWLALLGVFTTLFGLTWDVQWHSDVGPDTFWTLPHLFVYTGAALTGFAALSVVLLCTLVKDNLQPDWISILGNRFRAPIGFIVAGFGAFGFLSFGLFDQWWHLIFGFDVTIGSPPHVGLLLSDILSMVGVVLIFVRGKTVNHWGLALASAVAVAFSLPFLLAIFADFGWQIPLLAISALLLPLVMLFVAAVTRKPSMILVFALILLAIRTLGMLSLPALTTWYAQSLGWSLRDGASNIPQLSLLIPMFAPIAALLVMGLLLLAKRLKWPVWPVLLLAGAIAAPILYADGTLLPMPSAMLLLLPLALVGAITAWLGWQLGVVARSATLHTPQQAQAQSITAKKAAQI
jgi:hypothetical protein